MKKTLELVAYDLKFLAGEFHTLRFIVIAVAVIIFMWSYPVHFHPLVYAFVLGFAALEGGYMNAFFRLPNELERMILFPISWQRVIIAKAISTLLLTVPVLLISAVLVCYAAVGLPTIQILWDGMLLLMSASLSMVSLGHILSIQYPRRKVFFNFDEAPYFLFQTLALAVSSLPWLILKVRLESDIACLLYTALSGVVWYFVVVPRLANRLQREQHKVLERTNLTSLL
ncbi:MAG: hypothetical protein WBW16_15535 [Bacteroidota bacterium]